MNDHEMRAELVRELRGRVTDCINAAREEEYFAGVACAENAEAHRTSAARCRRRAQHYEQAIARIETAPMPGEG